MTKLWLWISVGFTVYVYIGYPALVWILQAMFGLTPRKDPD